MSVINSCVKCSGYYIVDINGRCFDREEFKEGYILNINNPFTFIDEKTGGLVVGYVVALPNGDTRVALVGEIKIDMIRRQVMNE